MKYQLIHLLVFSLILSLLSAEAEAQIYSPQLAGQFGQRIIYYPTGYYQGNVYNGIAQGMGTYYHMDGSFYYGNYANGFMHGHGMIVSPYYGYLEGHWSYGQYVGACSTSSHHYNYNQVQSLIEDIHYSRPNSNSTRDSYAEVSSPEGYKIKRIDPKTQMGKTLLGKYGN